MVQHNKGARKALGTSNGSTHESRSDCWHGTRSKRTKPYYCKECDDHLDEDEAYFYKGAWGPFCKECIIERDAEFDDIVWRPASECR